MSNVSRFVPRVWPPTILRVLSADRQEDHSGEIRQGRGVPVACEHPDQRETHLWGHHDQRVLDFNCGPLLCRKGVSIRGEGGQPRIRNIAPCGSRIGMFLGSSATQTSLSQKESPENSCCLLWGKQAHFWSERVFQQKRAEICVTRRWRREDILKDGLSRLV